LVIPTRQEKPMVQSATLPPLVRGQWFPMTYEEFERWVPDGMHGEWWDGEGIIFVAPTKEHQDGAIFLATLIGTFARIFDLGEVVIAPFEMRLREGARPEPDVLFVSKANAHRWHNKRLIGPADFAAEFTSDETAAHDRGRKFDEYQDAGVREYPIIDRRRRPGRFDFYRLDEHGLYREVEPDERGRYHSLVLPGFWLDPSWFWQDPLPGVEDVLLEMVPDAYEAWITAKLRARQRS
jgi:Uma2 family endonuclease